METAARHHWGHLREVEAAFWENKMGRCRHQDKLGETCPLPQRHPEGLVPRVTRCHLASHQGLSLSIDVPVRDRR